MFTTNYILSVWGREGCFFIKQFPILLHLFFFLNLLLVSLSKFCAVVPCYVLIHSTRQGNTRNYDYQTIAMAERGSKPHVIHTDKLQLGREVWKQHEHQDRMFTLKIGQVPKYVILKAIVYKSVDYQLFQNICAFWDTFI